ncbi:MAG: NUDIX hydrolase [Patescibacteria group bacterium]|jgi:ADP-ribose pyrophosphatase YjhB (NUDIX family)
MSKNIRPIAICIFYFQGKILATQGYDRVRKEKFYRPIGGGINFGETSRKALIREVKEELSTEITALKKMGTFENIFTYQGKKGHEIIFVYDAKFVDPKFYSKKKIIVSEEGTKSEAVWLKINDLSKKNILLYPVGLKELIKRNCKK